MYWLVFYNGFDKPELECAFSSDFMVKEYAERFIIGSHDRTSCYFVYLPYKNTVCSLEKFLKTVKEY